MNVHALEHVPFEGLGEIEPWVKVRGHHLTKTRFWLGDQLPETDHIDWLIVMGGPMGTSDEKLFPWLQKEKKFIRDVIDGGTLVLGICLGAQLIAEVLGASVHRSPYREIGWFPVDLTDEGGRSPFMAQFGSSFEAFHWHCDTFDLPPGALHLASSRACKHQAFSWQGHVLGLQFHLDSNPESVKSLLEHCPDDLQPGPHVQSPLSLAGHPKQFASLKRMLGILLSAMEYSHVRPAGHHV